MPAKSTTLGPITPITPIVIPEPVLEAPRTYRDVVVGSPSNNV